MSLGFIYFKTHRPGLKKSSKTCASLVPSRKSSGGSKNLTATKSDSQEQVYFHISNVRGYRNATRILDGQLPQLIHRQSPLRRATVDRRGANTSQRSTSGQHTPREGSNGNDESSGRAHRSGKTSGNDEPQTATGDDGNPGAKESKGAKEQPDAQKSQGRRKRRT